jgi:hypothetical protein
MKVSKIIIILCVIVQFSLAEKKENYEGVSEYRLDELWVLALAGGIQASGQWAITHWMSAEFATASNKSLPHWESWQVGRNSPWANDLSNYLLITGVYPIVDASLNTNVQTAFYESMILAELLFLNSGVNLWVRSSGLWPRPYYFDEKRSKSSQKPEILGSFYSGHASSTFALAMGWYQIKKMRGDEGWENLIGFGVATLSSSMRVIAGKHYVTDVVFGALVGSVLGFYYPQIRIGQTPFKYWVLPKFKGDDMKVSGAEINVSYVF